MRFTFRDSKQEAFAVVNCPVCKSKMKFSDKYEVNQSKSSHLIYKCLNCMTRKELVERTLSTFGGRC